MVDVAVITPTVPGREQLLLDALDSVRHQTVPCAHLIGVDITRRGPAATRNALVRLASTTWIAFLDDDDLAHPDHLARLLAAADRADVVYPDCVVEGRGGFQPGGPFDPDELRRCNYIPVTALVRRSCFLAVGGFPQVALEDWGLWLALLDHGARFVHVPEATWTYRFHATNRTWKG